MPDTAGAGAGSAFNASVVVAENAQPAPAAETEEDGNGLVSE
jgi:hypothetical protein